MMDAWSSEPYLLIQDENSNRIGFDAPEKRRYEVVEIRSQRVLAEV
jgi:hypothetical protein